MASEPVRRMHAGLRRKLGAPLADDLITVLAPLEHDELAQRSDIVRLDAKIDKLDARMEKLDAKIDRLDAKIEAQTARLLTVLIPIIVGVASLLFGAILAVVR